MSDIYGQDIKLDESGQPLVAANGELLLTDGVETGVQDIRLRLLTPLGELFYDSEFGSLIHEYFLDENVQSKRLAFEAEVERRVKDDPRVEFGTTSCSVTSWDDTGFKASLVWQFIDEDNPLNLVIAYDSTNKELVIADVNPRSGL